MELFSALCIIQASSVDGHRVSNMSCVDVQPDMVIGGVMYLLFVFGSVLLQDAQLQDRQRIQGPLVFATKPA